VSDTIRSSATKKPEHGARPRHANKKGRSFRPLIDWQREDLSWRNWRLTPKRVPMTSSRYMSHHTSPSYRELQAACSRVEPLA